MTKVLKSRVADGLKNFNAAYIVSTNGIAKDKDVPESTRSRARQLAGLLGVDAITDVESFVQTAGAEMAPAPAATAAPAQ